MFTLPDSLIRSGPTSCLYVRVSTPLTLSCSDANLTFFNMDVMRETPFLEIERDARDSATHEMFTDPGECAVASAAAAATCECDSDSSCEDDKYMWSGIIFCVGLIGLVAPTRTMQSLQLR